MTDLRHPCAMQGYRDAQRGHTANPHGLEPCASKWSGGYDLAAEEGLALLPRFAALKGRKEGRKR